METDAVDDVEQLNAMAVVETRAARLTEMNLCLILLILSLRFLLVLDQGIIGLLSIASWFFNNVVP